MSGMENNSTAFVGCDNGHVSILTTNYLKLFSVGEGFLWNEVFLLFTGQTSFKRTNKNCSSKQVLRNLEMYHGMTKLMIYFTD